MFLNWVHMQKNSREKKMPLRIWIHLSVRSTSTLKLRKKTHEKQCFSLKRRLLKSPSGWKTAMSKSENFTSRLPRTMKTSKSTRRNLPGSRSNVRRSYWNSSPRSKKSKYSRCNSKACFSHKWRSSTKMRLARKQLETLENTALNRILSRACPPQMILPKLRTITLMQFCRRRVNQLSAQLQRTCAQCMTWTVDVRAVLSQWAMRFRRRSQWPGTPSRDIGKGHVTNAGSTNESCKLITWYTSHGSYRTLPTDIHDSCAVGIELLS